MPKSLGSTDWHDDIPFSTEYGDYYYSKADGLAESRYVYLKHNNLPERFSTTQGENNTPLTIVETGFGTGLNFLATWEAWDKLPGPKRQLYYLSVEKHPLSAQNIARSLSRWPELKPYQQALLEVYPDTNEGFHIIKFAGGRLTLALLFGDINSELSKYSFAADCWYLDGFSPSKNPDMWSDTLFSLMSQRSVSDATFATFTTAKTIRDSLSAQGFSLIKPKGYGKKRDMLCGHLNTSPQPEMHRFYARSTPGWSVSSFQTETNPAAAETDFDALIIGGGIAGICTAEALSSSGLNVAIIEQNDAIPSGASAQRQLAMYAKLPTINNKERKFITHSLMFSQAYFRRLQSQYPAHTFWNACGVLQIAWNEKELQRQQQLMLNNPPPDSLVRLIDSDEASTHSGLQLTTGGLWYPHSGWLNPNAFCEALSTSKRFKTYTHAKVHQARWSDTGNHWQITTDNMDLSAQSLIICNANEAKHIAGIESYFPTKPLRGQVTSVKSPQLPKSRCIVCGEGYLNPAQDDVHQFGATYDLNSEDTRLSASDHSLNLASIQKWLPAWADKEQLHEAIIGGFCGLRCTTPDYFPIVGPVPVLAEMRRKFSRLRVDASSCADEFGEFYPNLYVNIGHGSKGMVTAAFAAELITSLIRKTPLPLSDELKSMVDPARFIIRHLKQKKL